MEGGFPPLFLVWNPPQLGTHEASSMASGLVPGRPGAGVGVSGWSFSFFEKSAVALDQLGGCCFSGWLAFQDVGERGVLY